MSESKSRWKWPIIFTVIGLLVIAAVVWFFRRDNGAGPQFQTVAVSRGDLIQVVTATGNLNPVVNVQVGCQVSGRIKALYVDYNSEVKSNQLIAEIDPRTYDAQVAQAQADLASSRANLELQQADAERASQLFSNKLVSQADYDTSIATLHQSMASTQIKQAALSNAVNNLGYCKIFSPVDGIVISRAVDVGQTVSASLSAPTLFQIANDLTHMQIDASVSEADVGGVEENQDVDFLVDAYPGRTFRGKVVQVRNAPTTVNNVVTYDCVIGVTNADYKLKPGMTATVSIVVAQHDGVLKVPNSALRVRPPESLVATAGTNATGAAPGGQTNQVARNNGGAGGRQGGGGRRRGGAGGAGGGRLVHTVYIIPANAGKNPKLQAVQIKTGITDGIATEIIEGLNEGDQIVTSVTAPPAQQQSSPMGFPRRF